MGTNLNDKITTDDGISIPQNVASWQIFVDVVIKLSSYGSSHLQIFFKIGALKGTLMQIWKFYYMFGFIQKQYPENFALLILGILELFNREICIFPKK